LLSEEKQVAGEPFAGLRLLHQFRINVEIVQNSHTQSDSYQTLGVIELYVQRAFAKVERLIVYDDLRREYGLYFIIVLRYTLSAAQEALVGGEFGFEFGKRINPIDWKLRFPKGRTKKTQLAHSLNGSALALRELWLQILEK